MANTENIRKMKEVNYTYFTFVSGDFLTEKIIALYNTYPGKVDDSKICIEKYQKRKNNQENFYIYFHFHYLVK